MKNITIQEGGTPKALTAAKLQTALVGGGSCLWVPEDETQLTAKSVTANGTYVAASEGVYGYSRVTVNVPAGRGSVIGKDENGVEKLITVDENGSLVTETLPTEIRILTLPTVTEYGDRAVISFDGLTVAAYDAQGNSLGEVPFAELLFPVTVTDIDQAEESEGYGQVTSYTVNGRTANPPIYVGHGAENIFTHNGVSVRVVENRGSVEGWGFLASTGGAVQTVLLVSDDFSGYLQRGTRGTWSGISNHSATYEGKTVRYATPGIVSSGGVYPFEVTPYASGIGSGEFAWLMKYGTRMVVGGQPIPVQWPRPGDGELLEATFYVTVVPAGGHGED